MNKGVCIQSFFKYYALFETFKWKYITGICIVVRRKIRTVCEARK